MAKNNQTIIVLLVVTIVLLAVALGIVIIKGGFLASKAGEVKDTSLTAQLTDLVPVSANVSSTLPASYGFVYTPDKSFDGNDFTWWSPNGEYYGQWIDYQLGQTQKVRGIKILNGSHYPEFSNGGEYFGDLYYQNAILTEAILQFSDGSTRNVSFRVFDGLQTIEFPEVSTSSIKIVFKGVVPGKRWQDVCISEFRALVVKEVF